MTAKPSDDELKKQFMEWYDLGTENGLESEHLAIKIGELIASAKEEGRREVLKDIENISDVVEDAVEHNKLIVIKSEEFLELKQKFQKEA